MRGIHSGALATIAVVVAISAPIASAEVTVTPSFTLLEVKGTQGPDRINLGCEANRITINGRRASGGRVRCDALEKLDLLALGGRDRIAIDLAPEIAEPTSDRRRNHNSSRVLVAGGDGDDSVVVRSGSNGSVVGGAGADRILQTGVSSFNISAGSGDDRIESRTDNFLRQFARGGAGRDVFEGGPGNDAFFGGPGADRLIGEGEGDLLEGGAGDDHLVGGAGFDGLAGGGGADRVFGGPNSDFLLGRDGSDKLAGGAGADRLYGGKGRDQLLGGPGVDTQTQKGLPQLFRDLPLGLIVSFGDRFEDFLELLQDRRSRR